MQITRRSHLYGDSYSPGRRNRKTLPALRPPKTLKPKGLSSYVITGGQRRPLTFIERRQRSTAPGLWITAWNLDERLGGPVSCGETDGVFPCRLRIRHGARPCPPAPATPTPLRPTSARSVPARTCRATACACS